MKVNEKLLQDLLEYEKIDIDFIDYDVNIVKLLTNEFIKLNKVICLKKLENDIYLCAIANYYDILVIDKLKAMFQNIKVIITTNEKIQKINSIVYTTINDFNYNIQSKENKDNYIEISNAPVVRIFESILEEGTSRNASDIHIEPLENTFRIRFRIDGILKEFMSFSKDMYEMLVSRIKVSSNLNITEKRLPQDGKMKRVINEIDYDFRISTLPTHYGEKIVIRILDGKSFNYSVETLGMTEEHNLLVNEMLKQKSGIILVTGPTGSGKSTTLYSFLKRLNNDEVNIVTVENPIEYTFAKITQVQVNEKIDFTYANILKSILRQDPDIIMIGEIRDEVTASIAMRLAITGHLVISTLHTIDTTGAITRLINLNIEPYMVASSLNTVISQRLVRKLCAKCKEAHITTKEEMLLLELDEEMTIYQKKGCPVCNGTGYVGRTGVYEILTMNEEIKELLNKNIDYTKLKKKAEKTNDLGIYKDAKRKVLQGITSFEEYMKIKAIENSK